MAVENGGYVVADDKAVANTVSYRFPENKQVHAGFLAQHQGLTDGGRIDEPELVGNQLHHVAAAERAAVNHPTEFFQQRGGSMQIGIGPGGEQGQLSQSGTVNCAGNRALQGADIPIVVRV